MNDLQFIKEHASCYIYDESQIRAQCRKLKTSLAAFDFLYSIKTNPFPAVIKCIQQEGFGADAASAQEVELSIQNGISPENIYYSSPGKTESDLEQCFEKCVLIADSLTEIAKINKEAKRRQQVVKIGIRINPDFSMDSDSAVSSKFGIDIEQAEALEVLLRECSSVKVSGIHIHIKSQVLDFEKLGRYYLKCFEIAKRISKLLKTNIEYINFGSGIGAVYDELQDIPVDLTKLSEMLDSMIDENHNSLSARMYIETGRFVTCNAGTFYTRIADIKQSKGKKYLIVEHGMNGFLRPALASLLQKNAGGVDLPGQEPLYTSSHAFSFEVLNNATSKEFVTIVGNLCTAIDVLGENVEMRAAEIGDIIAVSNAGCYAYSLSPLLFSSHGLPSQFIRRGDGNID